VWHFDVLVDLLLFVVWVRFVCGFMGMFRNVLSVREKSRCPRRWDRWAMVAADGGGLKA
jgi:hypothetical protein